MSKNNQLRRGIIVALFTVLSAGLLAGTVGLVTKVWGNTSEIKEGKAIQQTIMEDVKEIKGYVLLLLEKKGE